MVTRPTPCQQCKADLERARARVAELEKLLDRCYPCIGAVTGHFENAILRADVATCLAAREVQD